MKLTLGNGNTCPAPFCSPQKLHEQAETLTLADTVRRQPQLVLLTQSINNSGSFLIINIIVSIKKTNTYKGNMAVRAVYHIIHTNTFCGEKLGALEVKAEDKGSKHCE